MRRKVLTSTLGILTFLVTASGGYAGGTAVIKGSVKLSSAAPAAAKIKMSADPVCQQQHTGAVSSEEVVVNPNGTLRHVFVYVKDGVQPGAYPAPKEAVVLDQGGCLYTPHVFGVQVGQPLSIQNSDSTLHNVNAQPKVNKKFNIAQPVKGMKTVKIFDKPEMAIPFKCNVHPWMAAFGHAVEHPFFGVTDENGSFALKGLPAGTYTLEAWHEKFGAKSQSVTVADGESKEIAFTF
ncbi:MAG: carboxypeptidase regulatory-like domain-containing protein [Candidatus Omnitrophica bacterium]|nr:carboxypeptidase regulatory-like domain-containing protein [Candidatus Omnitrophota bacterium]